MSYRKKACLDCLCHKLKSSSQHYVVNLWYFRIPRSTTLGCNDLVLENWSRIKNTRSYCWKVLHILLTNTTTRHFSFKIRTGPTIPNHKLKIFGPELSLFSRLRYAGTRLIFWSGPTIIPKIIAMFWFVCPFVSYKRQNSRNDRAQYFWGNWHDPSECLCKFTNFYDFCKSLKNPQNIIIKSANFFVIAL